MDKNQKEIISKLEPYLISVQKKVNTNNSWGFGGAIKDVYQYKVGDIEFSIHTGKAYTRHGGTYPFFNLRFKHIIRSEETSVIKRLITDLIGEDSLKSETAGRWITTGKP